MRQKLNWVKYLAIFRITNYKARLPTAIATIEQPQHISCITHTFAIETSTIYKPPACKVRVKGDVWADELAPTQCITGGKVSN
ncbi:MAG: hypothetical protein V7K86_08135 [Nostoc sp.]|uniref:hypothetical protein n=1 Tax=Nostoc sp. TaxID=1180 RepID=UPI002FF47F5E